MLSLRFLITQLIGGALWSPWSYLDECWQTIPPIPGLYRLRLSHQESWLYLGQTSHLRRRIGMLKGVYGKEMPYAAPHTAGPALYAYRHLFPESRLEVAVCPLAIPDAARLALEALSIAWHRQRYQHSPWCQFGRMPFGWRSSSSNSASLVAQEKRYRGGPTSLSDASHLPDIAPPSSLTEGQPLQQHWLRLAWSPWMQAQESRTHSQKKEEGLYRVRAGDRLLFVGHGRLASRLAGYQQRTETFCSWVSGSWYPHQRLALVTDLLASALLLTMQIPQEQFGQKSHRADEMAPMQQPPLWPETLLQSAVHGERRKQK